MKVFMQPQREDRNNVAYFAQMPKLLDHEVPIATMSKKQRLIVNEDIREMNEKDDAMRTCLRAKTRDTSFGNE